MGQDNPYVAKDGAMHQFLPDETLIKHRDKLKQELKSAQQVVKRARIREQLLVVLTELAKRESAKR